MLESLFNKLTDFQACNFIKKRLQHCETCEIFKNIHSAEKLLLFVSPQNTIANSSGEFGLDETLTECQVFFFNMTILFDQMQPYHLYVS